MRIRPIRTDKDHAAALRRIETVMDAEQGTPAADELDVLATLVEAYEDRRFPIDEPDPVEAIRSFSISLHCDAAARRRAVFGK